APTALAAVWVADAGQQHDEARQVAALAAEAVGQPRAHARTPNDLVAAVHEDLRRRVIELRRVHRANDGQLVSDRREVRQQLREVCARLAARLELIRRAEQSRRAFDERETLALDK